MCNQKNVECRCHKCPNLYQEACPLAPIYMALTESFPGLPQKILALHDSVERLNKGIILSHKIRAACHLRIVKQLEANATENATIVND